MNKTLDRNDLITKLKLEGAPTDVQDKIIAQLGENIVKALMIDVISALQESDQEEFEKLVKKGDPQEIESFLKEKVSDFDMILKIKTEEQIDKVRKAMTS